VALATEDDVEDRLRRPLTSDESNYVDAVLDEASLIVTEWCDDDAWSTDAVPDMVILVVSRMVANVFSAGAEQLSPAGGDSVQLQAGPYGVTRHYSGDAATGGPWLTRDMKRKLRPWRTGGMAFVVDMVP